MPAFQKEAEIYYNCEAISRRCIICDSETIIEFGRHSISIAPAINKPKVKTTILKCTNCGLIFRDLPNDKFLTYYFENSWYTLERTRSLWLHERRDYFRSTFQYLDQKINHSYKKRILDVGCSYGDLLSIFKENGWEVQGLEVNKWASQYANGLGLNVNCGSIEESEYPRRHFDLVTFLDIFYYVQDPLLVIKKVNYFLKSGGYLYITLVNRNLFLNLYHWLSKLGFLRFNDFPYRFIGDSVWLFSQKSIFLLLKQAGFTNVELSCDVYWSKRKSLFVKLLNLLSLVISTITMNRVIIPPRLNVLAKKING